MPRSSGDGRPPIPAADLILARRSIRAFKPDPIPRATIEALLALASWAPSGTNMQPWQIIVLTGEPLAALSRELEALHMAGDEGESESSAPQTREPYRERRRAVGRSLYGALGIGRGDKEAMRRQHARNFRFFGAPVGLVITMDRDMESDYLLDCGMFLQTLMLAAVSIGLATCPQGAFTRYRTVIRRRLGISDDRTYVSALALGYPDWAAPENGVETERAPIDAFVRFVD